MPKKCTLVSPLLNGAEFTLSVAKTLHSSKQFPILRFASVKWRDTGSKHQKKTIEFLAGPSFFSSKKWIKLIPKTIGNRKRDCAWGCARGINTTWENLQIEKHKSGRRSFRSPDWFVLFDLQAQPHAQSLFLFPIVFGINLVYVNSTLKESFKTKAKKCHAMKNPGEVWARTCSTKPPSRSEALRFIDSVKSWSSTSESIKRGASDRLGDLVPQVWARTSPRFFTSWRFLAFVLKLSLNVLYCRTQANALLLCEK